MQHLRDALTAPLSGTGGIQARVASRRWDALSVELRGDLAAAQALQRQPENTSYHRRGPLIHHNFVLFRRVHLIAIYRLAADKQPLSLFVPLDAGDLFGDVLCVHVVHNGPERRDLVGAGVHTGVDAVQQGDVPHTVFREIALHIVAGHDVVAPQPGQILGNHHVHPSGLNVPQHSPELRAVETGARPAVVHIEAGHRHPPLAGKVLQHGPLVADAL